MCIYDFFVQFGRWLLSCCSMVPSLGHLQITATVYNVVIECNECRVLNPCSHSTTSVPHSRAENVNLPADPEYRRPHE